MHTAIQPHPDEHRRPATLDLVAAGLLIATVVLHVVAMFPTYFVGGSSGSSLTSSPDQAALYAVLAASWALALAIGLTGPHRTPVAAALAVGVAACELGFRVADLGDAVRYGSSLVGAGLWLMEAAWLVGAAGAVLAVLAALRRHRSAPVAAVPASAPRPAEWHVDWAAPPVDAPDNPYAEAGADVAAGGGAGQGELAEAPAAGAEAPAAGAATPDGDGTTATAAISVPGSTDVTSALPTGEPTGTWDSAAVKPPPTGAGAGEDAHERWAWTMLIGVLALLVAGAFLPAWDHAVAYSTVTGRGISRSLGNAFSGPWEQVLGTVLAAAAMAVVPIVAVRLRNRAVGAAAVCGMLLVLGSQLTAAVVQVDQPLSPAQIGMSAGQASQLGLELALKLTGWFTVDALAAYALFAAVMVWATLRAHHENSTGTPPSAPEVRRDAVPWAS